MFKACGFAWLILRFDSLPKESISLRRLGNEVRGDFKESRMTSAKAATLNSLSFTVIPCMFGLSLNLLRKGSRVKI